MEPWLLTFSFFKFKNVLLKGANIRKFRGLISGNLVLSSNLVLLDFIDCFIRALFSDYAILFITTFYPNFPNFLFFLNEWFNKFTPLLIFFPPRTILGPTKYIFSTLKKETRPYTELFFRLEEKLFVTVLLKVSLKPLSFNFYNRSLATKLLLVTMGSSILNAQTKSLC